MSGQIKTPEELEVMREGGALLAEIRTKLLSQVIVGNNPLEIDRMAKKLIKATGGMPSFMTVSGYKWATCISVNEGVVHAIPTSKPLAPMDVVSLDVGLLYRGYHTDTSWSLVVSRDENKSSQEKMELTQRQEFLSVGERALSQAIKQARPGNRVGHISKAIQTVIESHDFAVVASLVGHGIGRELHEPPQIPGILTRNVNATPRLQVGMTLAVEVIYTRGSPEIVHINDDGWTLATADGNLAGLFEHTVSIERDGPVVLT